MEEKGSCKDKKILIVEDERPARLALNKKLTAEGFKVLEAKDGKEGLEIVKSEKPNLILLDIKMPVMTGTEVLSELKKDKDLEGIQVIVLTNDSTTDTMTEALAKGGTHYFVKADTPLEAIVGKIKLMLNCE